jgi:hypothetical protein
MRLKRYAVINSAGDVMSQTISYTKKKSIQKYMGLMADLGISFKSLQKIWGVQVKPITIEYNNDQQNKD